MLNYCVCRRGGVAVPTFVPESQTASIRKSTYFLGRGEDKEARGGVVVVCSVRHLVKVWGELKYFDIFSPASSVCITDSLHVQTNQHKNENTKFSNFCS